MTEVLLMGSLASLGTTLRSRIASLTLAMAPVGMSELLHEFGVDWKLLVAQAVNFFVLLLILRKFAYQPILKILKRRREEIQKGVRYTREAAEKMKQIETVRQQALDQAQREALQIVTDAQRRGEERRDEILADANRKREGVVADAKRAISQEKAMMAEEVLTGARELIHEGISHVIGKLPRERSDALVEEALRELKRIHPVRDRAD